MKQQIYHKDVMLILAASFFYMACTMLITPLITGFSESLGATGTVMGIVGGIMTICSLACRPIVGNYADKVSKYRLSSIGAVLMAIACLGYVAAQGNTALILSRILHGIGFSCCSVCMSTWLSSMLPRNKVGSGMGLYGTMNALSMALAPALGIKLYSLLGYRYAFILAAICAVVTAVMIQFVGDKGNPKIAANADREKMQIADKNVIPVAIIIMLFAIPYCATQSFLVSYVKARQLSVSVSLFFPLYAVALLILRLVLKEYFDKIKFKTFVYLCAGCAFVAMLLLALMNHTVMMVFAAIFMAGGYGIMCSVAQSNAILLASNGKEGLANSTYYMGIDLGMALGPMIGGILYESVDISLFYPMLMITLPFCFLVHIGAEKRKRMR